jgi:2-oxoisovalerate dehydrogenase E1 component
MLTGSGKLTETLFGVNTADWLTPDWIGLLTPYHPKNSTFSTLTITKHSDLNTLETSPQSLLYLFRDIYRARYLDDKCIILYKQNKCFFHVGCAGHEAIQVAAARVFQTGHDWFYPYYRDLALVAALGMSNRDLLMNFMNKALDSNSGGRQMPMHYSSVAMQIVSQSSPTGTQFNQAVGSALGCKLRKVTRAVYVSAGDGTCAQGDFHEALNWSAREKLPIVFVIQNNNYAISVPLKQQIANDSIVALTAGYKNLQRLTVDGSDVLASWNALKIAHARAVKGEGPTLVEAHVPRLQSHSISDNQLKYRSSAEVESLQHLCPLIQLENILLEQSIATKEQLDAIKERIRQEIDTESTAVEQLAEADPATVNDYIYPNPAPWEGVEEHPPTEGEETYIVDAINHTLQDEMSRDSNVLVYGQDVADGKGGVFTVTLGLTNRFGVERCFNAQLAESSIVGVAIGLACHGFRPVAEIQFGDYVWTAMMQIRNELAMMCYRSNGAWRCPVVLRIPVGGYIRGAAYHSQNIEATFAHFAGLNVVFPSNATDARGLLKSAIRGDNPVLFLEHKGLYRQPYAKGIEGSMDSLVPIGRGKIVRPGTHVTIVSWGLVLHKCLAVARQLEKEGVLVEIIDVRSIVPLDIEIIETSVRKTSRILIVHEDSAFMGFGAEITAQIADVCFAFLDAPVRRLGMKHVAHVPHPPGLEEAVLPHEPDILAACKALLAF